MRRVLVLGLSAGACWLAACGGDGREGEATAAGAGGAVTAGAASGNTAGMPSGAASSSGGTPGTNGGSSAGMAPNAGGPAMVGGSGMGEAGSPDMPSGGNEAEGGASGAGPGDAGGSSSGGEGGEPAAPAPCGDVASGSAATRVRFRDQFVAYGAMCEGEQQAAVCTDGTLGAWSGTFIEETCSPLPPGDCESVSHGAHAERTRFEAPTVPYGQKCRSEKQTALCTNGSLGAWSGVFAFEACTVQPPAACGATPHGGYAQRVRYLNATEPYGGACAAEQQQALCTNGSLGAWSGVFEFDACVVGPAADCEGTPHGQSRERIRYLVPGVPYGEACPKELQSQTCDNGSWSEWTGSYGFESCAVAPPLPCDNQPHGTVQSYKAYAQFTVEYGGSCLSEIRTRVCNNGAWTPWTGSYEAYSCSVNECAEGMKQTRSCGLNNRGTQTRSCVVSGPLAGKWDPSWGTCIDPDVCKDGANVPSIPCQGGLGWEPRTCVSGQFLPSGMCGACSGKYVDPCGQHKTSEACSKDPSCGVWIYNPTPHCAKTVNDTTQCQNLYAPQWCLPERGCNWAWF